MCYVYPYLGKMNPFLLVFFSNGLVQPPMRRDLNKGKDVFFVFFLGGEKVDRCDAYYTHIYVT